MPLTRTDTDQEFSNGVAVTTTTRTVDITAPLIELDQAGKARAAFTANRAYMAIAAPTNPQVVAQVRSLTRQLQAVIRLTVARDLLTDETID